MRVRWAASSAERRSSTLRDTCNQSRSRNTMSSLRRDRSRSSRAKACSNRRRRTSWPDTATTAGVSISAASSSARAMVDSAWTRRKAAAERRSSLETKRAVTNSNWALSTASTACCQRSTEVARVSSAERRATTKALDAFITFWAMVNSSANWLLRHEAGLRRAMRSPDFTWVPSARRSTSSQSVLARRMRRASLASRTPRSRTWPKLGG